MKAPGLKSEPLQLLRELIAIPSVNPAFMPPGDPRSGEARIGEFVTATAAMAGLDVEFQEVLPGRTNVFARLFPFGKTRSHVLLGPHLDTVGHAGMPDSMFLPRQQNGRLHGRGACDTKGCVAAMLGALMAVARSGRRPANTLVTFAGFVDEEDGQRGSRFLAASGAKANLAIIGEPTRLQVVTAHKGDLWLKIETRGKAAHGARPELGKNAVHAMAKIIDRLETEYAASLRKKAHPLLGRPTVNVGTVAGGTQPNIVPDQCVISIDRRTIPGETETSVRRELNALIKQTGAKAAILNTKAAACLPMETDATQPLVQEFLKSAGGRKPVGVDFFCDASVLANAGIPSVVFGPGDIAQAHTADEWISVRQLDEATKTLERFLRSLP